MRFDGCLSNLEFLRNFWLSQAASTEAFHPSTPGVPEPVSRTLHIQVAKVVTAHAASVGDMLLGVPLLCSAGKYLEWKLDREMTAEQFSLFPEEC